MSERPKRDVSANAAIGDCEHCGGNANTLLGGEHIWKCSEIYHKNEATPNDDLRELVKEWRDTAWEMLQDTDEYKNPTARIGAANQMLDMADELEAVIGDGDD